MGNYSLVILAKTLGRDVMADSSRGEHITSQGTIVYSGDIVGVVADPSGAVLPNVSVTLKRNAKGNTQVQSTNSHGTYRFSLLAPGSYTVSVAAPGFQEAMMSGVVTIGQATTLNIVLSLGGATSTVEVTSDAPLLQTENADVSTSFSQTQISQMPNPAMI